MPIQAACLPQSGQAAEGGGTDMVHPCNSVKGEWRPEPGMFLCTSVIGKGGEGTLLMKS